MEKVYDINKQLEKALDKLDMMSEDEAREWIAELDREEIARMAEHLLKQIKLENNLK